MIRNPKPGSEVEVEQICIVYCIVIVLSSMLTSLSYRQFDIIRCSFQFQFQFYDPRSLASQCLFSPLSPRSIRLGSTLIPIHNTDKHKSDDPKDDIIFFCNQLI